MVKIVPLPDLPKPASDVSCASVIANEGELVLGYRLPSAPVDWTKIRSPDQIPAERFVVIRMSATIHKFGYPNDEALHGHPLHDAGLPYYSACEVIGSPWPSELAEQNRVHSGHRDEMFTSLRHLIFTFHDTTFECLCSEFRHHTFKGTEEDLLPRMMRTLNPR